MFLHWKHYFELLFSYSLITVLLLKCYFNRFSTNRRRSSFSISPVKRSTTCPFFTPKTVGIPVTCATKQSQHINVMVLVIKFRHKVWDKKLRFSFFSLLILYVTRIWNLRVSVYLVVIRQQGYANIANKCNESCLEVGENWVIHVPIFNQYLLDAA